MKFIVASSLALAGFAAAATNSTVSPVGTSCQSTYNTCTGTTCSDDLTKCQASCEATYNDCRVAANANMATCAAGYASCLGTNPFAAGTANNATVGGTATAGGIAYTTEVVTSFTTFCPFATQLTYNGQTYTASSATVLTITNCPCTITKAVSSATPTGNTAITTSTGSSGNSSQPTPVAFTGAGNKAVLAGSSLVAGIAGLAFFL